jgi:ABC-type transport system substrate-binding protein
MKKAHLAILILVSLLMASCFGNIILGIRSSGIKSPTLGNILKIGILERNFPAVLDPIDSWDSVSNDMIRHVCDTLWSYDLVDPKLPITMRLATSYFWNAEMDELTVSLRNDVWFHNGAKFNATAVKFIFDRITYFINASGTLPDTTHVCDPSYLFFNMDGDPILNRTEINQIVSLYMYYPMKHVLFYTLIRLLQKNT